MCFMLDVTIMAVIFSVGFSRPLEGKMSTEKVVVSHHFEKLWCGLNWEKVGRCVAPYQWLGGPTATEVRCSGAAYR